LKEREEKGKRESAAKPGSFQKKGGRRITREKGMTELSIHRLKRAESIKKGGRGEKKLRPCWGGSASAIWKEKKDRPLNELNLGTREGEGERRGLRRHLKNLSKEKFFVHNRGVGGGKKGVSGRGRIWMPLSLRKIAAPNLVWNRNDEKGLQSREGRLEP